jgi:hypothetical protein
VVENYNADSKKVIRAVEIPESMSSVPCSL